jgi:hypothetical protein
VGIRGDHLMIIWSGPEGYGEQFGGPTARRECCRFPSTALAVDHLGLSCDDGSQDFLLFALRQVEVVLGAPVIGRLYTCSSATGSVLSNQRITLLQGTAVPPHWLQ